VIHKAFALAASIPWAIEPQWLTTILEIANREGPGPEAVAQQVGRPLDNTRTVTVRDGVAVIPVTGPIFRYANAFSAISGATSVQILAKDFATALSDPSVEAILFEVDSPGGEVTGIHEFASQVYAARGQKPISVYAGGACCSAAYWIAAAADEIVVDATAQVGSIGVYRAFPKGDEASAKAIEIVSSQSPRKNLDPTTKDGRADVQAYVDAIADVFVGDVARGRDVSTDTVLKDFGRGGVFVGEAAVKAGLVDRIGSLEETITALRARADAEKGHVLMKDFATALGLGESATEQDITAAIAERETARADLLAVTGKATIAEALATVRAWQVSAEEHAKLAEQLTAMRASQKAAEIDSILGEARKAGKLTKDLESIARANFAEPSALKAFVDALPVVVTTEASATPSDIVNVSSLTPEERRIAALTGVTEESFLATKSALTKRSPVISKE